MKAAKDTGKRRCRCLSTFAKGFESRVFGLDKSKPMILNPSKIAEAVTVKMRPIRNWIKILFCCPKMRPEITEDNTNIQANEHTKAATLMFELKSRGRG